MSEFAGKVKVTKRVFFSEETGYGVFRATILKKKEGTTLVGNLLDVGEGDFLEIEGSEMTHPKFGEQIKVARYKTIMPEDKDGIIKWMSSRYTGVGPKLAEKIYDQFGDETFHVLENQPDRLSQVKGIRRVVIDAVKEAAEANKILRDLTVKLSPFGIGTETIYKIYKEYGDGTMEMLELNPYELIKKVRGVGFKIADMVARGMGIEKNDPFRIRAGLLFSVDQYEQKFGHLYIEEPELIRQGTRLLDVDDADIVTGINELLDRNELVCEEIPEKVLVSGRNYGLEESVARNLHLLSTGDTTLKPLSVDFNFISRQMDIELTEEQQRAVLSAVNNRITVITGGPGTGKTTIIRAIIEAFVKQDKEVLLAAPTGRAAKRIDEATGYAASTIHRMLKIDAETRKFVHNESNPLKADAVIVDEFSMVDIHLFYSLLKAVSVHTRLVIIGDKDQLPSVGPGNVLRDIIGSGFFDIIYLNRNFRQTEESLIIENAYRINNGDDLMIKPYADDLDFVFINAKNEQHAMEKVIGIIRYYHDKYHFNSPDFQVLSPMYRGLAGIDNLNARVQETFNSNPALLKKEQREYKEDDKVMQLKNNYEKEIFNGEQGIVDSYSSEKKSLKVNVEGSIIEYALNELDELTLSYAVSVHKAQGSEYEMMVLVLLPSHSIMLNRELFYTAVTRAKNKLFLISDLATVRRAISNSTPSERKTLLPRRLADVFSWQ